MDLNLNQVRFVTQHYPELQGLKWLPLAAVCLMSAMWRRGWFGPHLHGEPRAAAIWFFAAFTAAVILGCVIRAWYTRTFGFVSPLPSGPLPDLLIGFVTGLWVDQQLYGPLPIASLLIAAALLGLGVAYRATQRHYLAVAFVWFFMSFIAFRSSDAAAVLDLATAVCLTIAGVGDHRLLRQTLQPQIEV